MIDSPRFPSPLPATILSFSLSAAILAAAQTAHQPRVAPGPGEPDWKVILKDRYGLDLFQDLLNPVQNRPESTPGLFRKAGPGPVVYTPLIALGLETRTRGGWYTPPPKGKEPPRKVVLWTYTYKNTAEDLKTGAHLPPPLESGSRREFDPGDQPFGLWVSNDGLPDGGVFTQPGQVAIQNARLHKQPYKVMIYPVIDQATGKRVPGSLLLGWEYSTNDDFQDVVCRVDNVILIKE